MRLLCVYCRRTDLTMVLDPDLMPMIAMCEDCHSRLVPGTTPPAEGQT